MKEEKTEGCLNDYKMGGDQSTTSKLSPSFPFFVVTLIRLCSLNGGISTPSSAANRDMNSSVIMCTFTSAMPCSGVR